MRSMVLFVLIFLSGICSAQLPEYYVYLVKGDVTLLKPNKKSEKIKQKHLIFKEDVLAIPANSEVTLVNKDANYIVLNTPGTIKVSELGKKTHDSYTGVTKKYMHLVWHELLDPGYDYTKFKQQNLGGTWGGASRGGPCPKLIWPVNGLKTSMDSVKFRWNKTSPAASYTFYIYDDKGDEVVKMQSLDTVKTVDLKQGLKLQPGKYYWLIKSSEGGCEDEDPHFIELMSGADEASLVASLVPQTVEVDLISQLDKIDRLEKNALIFKASDYYAAVIKVNPGNLPLFKSYIAFLLKYGFDTEAQSAWQNLVQTPR
jgi:hypothetical protein